MKAKKTLLCIVENNIRFLAGSVEEAIAHNLANAKGWYDKGIINNPVAPEMYVWGNRKNQYGGRKLKGCFYIGKWTEEPRV